MRPIEAWKQDPFASDGRGWMHPADDRFATRLDPRGKGFEGPPVSLGGIMGEDAQGLWFAQDHYCLALEHPEIWPVLLAVQSGDAEITQQDREALSACDFLLKAHAVAAIRREQARDVEDT
jgi:hypothetical protein